MSLKQTVPPAVEPVSLQEAKDHLRVDAAGDDALIDVLIVAARNWAETFTNRQLITATYEWKLDRFPASSSVPLLIPRAPAVAVASITYLDTSGVSQTWAVAKYQVDLDSAPGRILPVETESYPSTQHGTINAVTVTFTAGYGAAGQVPQELKQAMLLVIGHLYENREDVIVGVAPAQVPHGAEWLAWPLRVIWF